MGVGRVYMQRTEGHEGPESQPEKHVRPIAVSTGESSSGIVDDTHLAVARWRYGQVAATRSRGRRRIPFWLWITNNLGSMENRQTLHEG